MFCFNPILHENRSIPLISKFRRMGKRETPNFLSKYKYGNKEKGIKNFHLNIRSLKNKMPEVKNILSSESPDILGLSEVELKKDAVKLASLKVPNYNLLLPKSWASLGSARVVVYIRKSLTYERVDQLESTQFQSIWFKASLINSNKINFCHGYREHLDTL